MGQLARTAAIAAGLSFVIAALVDLMILGIAVAIAGPIVVSIPGRTQAVGIGEVLTVVALAAIVAAAITAVLSRWWWGSLVVVIAGAVVTLGSLVAVFSANTATGVAALALMHLFTGGTLVIVNVILQRRSARAAQPA